MASVNRAIILGNLGKDPETRFLPSGEAVCNFSIATSETWKDKSSGEKKEATTWHNICTFGKLAEICGQYLKKGSSVYIEGKIQTRKWQDKSGQDRYTTEIRADSMQMLGGKPTGDTPRSEPKQPAKGGGGNDNSGFGDMSDDCPFASCAHADEPMLRKLRRA